MRNHPFISGTFLFLSGIFATHAIEQLIESIKALPNWASFIIAIILGLFSWLTRPKPKVVVKNVIPRELSLTRHRQIRRRALVGIVSPFKWHDKTSPPKTLKDLNDDIQKGATPNFGQTSLGPIIQVIDEYIDNNDLESIWLISSDKSIGCTKTIRDYLVKIRNFAPENIAYDDKWSIGDAFIKEAVDETRELFASAHNEALKKYKSNEIISEVTGGTKAMTIGAVLACMNPETDIQYTAIIRKPKTKLDSIFYRFEVNVPNK